MNWVDYISRIRPESTYSQYGEEAFIQYIFQQIGEQSRHFVDIGAHNGLFLSNTRLLHDKGWSGLMIDGSHENELVNKHFITRENVLDILAQYDTPIEFDLLSIDIDGNDYWILEKVLSKYKPRVIISEYNAEHPIEESKTIVYDPAFRFENNNYYGYTHAAGEKLAAKHGYKIIHQHSALNLFYVRSSELPEGEITVPKVQHTWWGNPTDKEWVTI